MPVAEPRNGRVEHGIDDGAVHALRVDIGSDRLHPLSTQVKALRGAELNPAALPDRFSTRRRPWVIKPSRYDLIVPDGRTRRGRRR
jgi:hypothetical protein